MKIILLPQANRGFRRVHIYENENLELIISSKEELLESTTLTLKVLRSVGVSPNGKRVAYASDEENNVEVFEVKSKKVLGKFTGNKMTLTKILFLNEKEFLVASDAKIVNRYIINKE